MDEKNVRFAHNLICLKKIKWFSLSEQIIINLRQFLFAFPMRSLFADLNTIQNDIELRICQLIGSIHWDIFSP